LIIFLKSELMENERITIEIYLSRSTNELISKIDDYRTNLLENNIISHSSYKKIERGIYIISLNKDDFTKKVQKEFKDILGEVSYKVI